MSACRRLRLGAVLIPLSLHIGCLPIDRWPIQPSPQPAGREYDLRADGSDLNGFLLNPAWVSQALDPSGPPVSDACRSNRRKVFKDGTCTSQPVRYDEATMPALAACRLGSSFPGHINWAPATVTGTVSWRTWAAPWDNDATFHFVPDDGVSGMTDGNEVIPGAGVRYIELEFTTDETLAAFSTPWWTGLWDAILRWANSQDTDAAIRAWLNPADPDGRQRAVVTGLFGIDCEHGCKSEVHPVLGLALETERTSTASAWSIFARNWGTEGFCASRLHYLDLPGRALRLSLPGPAPAGAQRLASVTFLEYATLYPEETPDPVVEWDAAGGQAVLAFSLPEPDAHPLSELVVRLTWEPAGEIAPGVAGRPSVRPGGEAAAEIARSAEGLLGAAVPRGWQRGAPPPQVARTTPKTLAPLRAVGSYSRTRTLPQAAPVPDAKKPDVQRWLDDRQKARQAMLRRLCDERGQLVPGFTPEQSRRLCGAAGR